MKDTGYSIEEEQEIIRLAQRGDLSAFEAIVKRHEGMMYNMAFRITGNAEDASEVVQDAFVSAYRCLTSFEGRSRLSTWLYTITLNAARNRLTQSRSRVAREAYSLDDPPADGKGSALHEPASGEPSALARLEAKELRQMVQDCLSRLEEEFRTVIVLRDVQGFSYAEIGSMLGIADGTVKSRISRARESVKDCLKRLKGLQR